MKNLCKQGVLNIWRWDRSSSPFLYFKVFTAYVNSRFLRGWLGANTSKHLCVTFRTR